MNEDNNTVGEQDGALELDVAALLERVAAVIGEIEQAKRERSIDDMRAARTHLAALHGVAQLRRQAERQNKTA
jgi:hypothetical protein